jgi:hypothetical protein
MARKPPIEPAAALLALEHTLGGLMDATHARRFSPALIAWLVVFVLLNVGDLVSTYLALAIGFHEGNPLMSVLLVRYGFSALIVYKLGVVLVVGLGVALLRRFHPRLALVTLIVCNVLVFAAVALNVVQFNFG